MKKLLLNVFLVAGLIIYASEVAAAASVEVSLDKISASLESSLIIDGTQVEMYGYHNFNEVMIINGGVLKVTPYNPYVPGTGYVYLVADSILVDETSAIIADGSGYNPAVGVGGLGQGGEGGPLADAGGGGYGGRGASCNGGATYGDESSTSIYLGSGGGNLRWVFNVAYGGAGGGAIVLQARGTVHIKGKVTSKGSTGQILSGGLEAGAGSGGGILIFGEDVLIRGCLNVSGGNSNYTAGCGGGGGRIKVFATYRLDTSSAQTIYSGGIWNGRVCPWPSEQGTTFFGIIPTGPAGAPPNEDYFLGYQDNKLGSTSDPVNTATGNFFHSETDLSIASRGLPLVFSRHYNSEDRKSGPLGPGWTHSYYIHLTNDANLVSVHWGDGRTDYWNPDGLGGYEPNTAGLYDSLTKNGSNWVLTKKNLDKYNFNADGLLTDISDKNSNTITLSYNHPTDPNLLTSVSDPAGKTVTLSYNPQGLLSSITDFAAPARNVSYTYTAGRLTQVIDVMGNGIQYGYDPNGYLETITDQRGVVTVRNQYDSQGRVIKQWDGNNNLSQFAYDTPAANQTTITDPNGKATVHTHISGYKLLYSIQNPLGHSIYYGYDEQGNRTKVTDRNSNNTYFAYDSRGNVIETTNADGGKTIVDYNDSNFPDLPTKKVDALGNVTHWWYDHKGNVIRQIDPNGFERMWTYNTFGQKLTETDENGNTTNYIYDANGLLKEIIDPNGNHTWYGYDELWRLTHITDGRGSSAGDPAHTTVNIYDKADRVISVNGPITSRTYQYDKIGNRTAAINGRGFKTTYEYDNNNNLRKVIRPAPGDVNQVMEYQYDSLNRRIRFVDPNGNISRYDYDAGGRLLKEINPEGDETIFTYDPHGNILSITDGNGVTIFYAYDSMHRKNHQYDELGNHWYWQYDKLGQLTKHTDAIGYKTTYGYDSLGRLIAVTDDANKITQYKYDAVGNLKEIIDAAGITIERRFYNTANRIIRKEDALGNAYEYTYDGAGNQISRKDANGNITIYVYDNQSRLTEIHYPDSNQVTYSYDDNGNLLTMTDPTGTTTYTYDKLDMLTSSTDSFGKTVQYAYDIIGNRTRVNYPADSNNPARMVNYTYDKANRLDKVIDWTGRTWDYTVDKAGRITDINYPNGIREQRTYDHAGRLSSLLYKNSSDANLITYSYVRDAAGNPIEIKETGTLEPVLNLPLKEDYSYDNDNRLTETTKPATYGYDDNGNTTSKVDGGITTAFSYDYENRLISQTTGSSTVQHIYDGQGNRIARNDNGLNTRYVLDRGRSISHVLCETDKSGNIIAYYVHGPKLLARIGTDGSERYYHTDHIGSVVALTNETETITDRYAYTPFGVPTDHEGATPNPFTYVGGLGVMSEADDLYFMRARFYDPEAGRFLSKDPVGGSFNNPQNLNYYLYVTSNPLLLADPSGLYVDDLIRAIVGTIETPWTLVYSVGLGIGSITHAGIASVAAFAGNQELSEQYSEFSTLEKAMARDKIFNWAEEIQQKNTAESVEAQIYLRSHPELSPVYETLEQGAKGAHLGYSILSFGSSVSQFGKAGGIAQFARTGGKIESGLRLTTADWSILIRFGMLTKDYFSLLNALERVGNVPYIGPADVQSISGFIKGGGTGSGGGGGGAQ